MGTSVAGSQTTNDNKRYDATVTEVGSKVAQDVNLLPSGSSLINFQWDAFTVSYGSTTTDYVFTLGGDAAGTIRLTYTDSSKENISSAERL